MEIEKNKIALEKELRTYEPDTQANLRLQIMGIGRETEDEIRKRFMEFWEWTKGKLRDETSCGAESAKAIGGIGESILGNE